MTQQYVDAFSAVSLYPGVVSSYDGYPADLFSVVVMPDDGSVVSPSLNLYASIHWLDAYGSYDDHHAVDVSYDELVLGIIDESKVGRVRTRVKDKI